MVTRAVVVGRVEGALRRIRRLDPKFRAFTEVWEDDARERARAVDTALALAGLPFAVKGPSGIRSYAAVRLIEAGAVPVGATAVPGGGTHWGTWGLGRYGPTVNPYRADRTPGGSSAGSAVAVATGMVPLATGSDGAGSVRIPAAWCGVLGLKTTNGLLPSPDRTGLASAGVLTRRVALAEAYLRCVLDGVAGWGGRGEESRGTGPWRPVDAVYAPDLGFADVDPGVAAVARAGAGRLVAAGVVRRRRGRFGGERADFTLLDPREAWFAIRGGEAAPGAGPDGAGALAQEIRAENDRRLDRLFARTPLLLTPVTPNVPHGHEGPGARYSTALTWAFNVSGHPAMSIPVGWTKDGCPVGLHLVADRGREALLLDVARAAERGGVTRLRRSRADDGGRPPLPPSAAG
ncbi:amidase [Streptomyces sp. NBC_01497]|uniref:amidase n=1 Tax=Streptomyces sp. NBC_01497 TaxID=2903885 RepID=UPI002E35F532|nr:amidase [Streptomyces sp. NBC_01497]